MFVGSRVRPVRRADNLTAICEPIVETRPVQRANRVRPVDRGTIFGRSLRPTRKLELDVKSM
jgi:methyl coenzyme M reductase gamma subunit